MVPVLANNSNKKDQTTRVKLTSHLIRKLLMMAIMVLISRQKTSGMQVHQPEIKMWDQSNSILNTNSNNLNTSKITLSNLGRMHTVKHQMKKLQ